MAKTRERLSKIAIAPNCGKREAASPPPCRALLYGLWVHGRGKDEIYAFTTCRI